jgi:quercetin dioxygenase-like cupin family protein
LAPGDIDSSTGRIEDLDLNISEEVLMGIAAVAIALVGFSGVVTALVVPGIITLYSVFIPIGLELVIENSDTIWRVSNAGCLLGHLLGVTHFIRAGSTESILFSHKIGLTVTFLVTALMLGSSVGLGSWPDVTFLLGLLLGIGVSVYLRSAHQARAKLSGTCRASAAVTFMERIMRPSAWLAVSSLILPVAASTAATDATASGFIHLQADDVPYEADPEVPGLGYAVLFGDPAEPGVYVVRLKIPPGLTFPPHYHDRDRHITVISGIWAFGTGDSGKCEDTVPLTAGAYVMHPKGGVHFDGACGDDFVEVQIIGQGPVETTWIDEVD